MRNKIIKYGLIIGLPTIGLGFTIFIIISTALGWYTNVNQTGHIDANTKNVGFSYTINGVELEEDEYDISNLAFFDIDSMFEGDYFSDMCFEIELNVKNITDSPLNYSIKFEGEKKIITGVSNSYVACVMSPQKLGYVLTTDTEVKSGKTYYEYDEDTHKYTVSNMAVGHSITENDNLYIFRSKYVKDTYVATSDTEFKENKIYYQKEDSQYIASATRGSNIERYKTVTEIEHIYEAAYTKVATDATYNSGLTYYAYVESTNGNYYVPAASDTVTEDNFKNYYLLTPNTYLETTDRVFQNEKYYYYDTNSTTYIEINKVIPGTNTNINQYWERGSKVESLFVDNLDVTYTPNMESANPFMATYNGGYLEKKNDTQSLYLYIFGVQEIDTAQNNDFIYNTHNFKITIESSSESSWNVTDITSAPQENNNEEPSNDEENQNGD